MAESGLSAIVSVKQQRVRSTNEVMYRARDLAAVRAYYHGELGFPIIIDTPKVLGFDTGALNLYFEPGEPNFAVLEFEVADLDKARADLLAAGCTIVEDDPDLPRLYLRDRFGVVFNVNEA
ncbi:MAG TPA: VOC family protein [Candidatus Eremiobacteraceae bacterium]|nr:VOC family protein [Candidatus Eremiobacteraceae bacterium]